jgi:hypothetical protein
MPGTALASQAVLLAGSCVAVLAANRRHHGPVSHGWTVAWYSRSRRPVPTRQWAGPGRGRRAWPEQLHPGSGPRQRPKNRP